ncbi:U2-type spliceosomal complex subunit CWC22 [Lachancea thermotolerans CBS 6340]|uniref:Pre-mRNA-splicing factor CWC22 n=1 Tax=Lachancea thermotolerans (strain ATCC 56472 / CBS 6340 / NRRL Y-8284) TaxID=559295 RepID=C5DDB8_LACTC|nr:KLTH0B09900p [Lachancea thermotolerans CBS 6340]CAR21779.1 KLTH0B09900p [Lachancea thermotolerans CBS 6340]
MSQEDQDVVILQKESWDHLKSYIKQCFRSLTRSSVVEEYRKLFAVNILWGERLVVSSVLQKQSAGDSSEILAALTSLLNAHIPQLGELLIEETTSRFLNAFKTHNSKGCYAMAALIAELFNYEVLHEILILQILHLLMEGVNVDSACLAMFVLSKCGRQLMLVAKTAHDLAFESLRKFFQENKVERAVYRRFEDLFDLRKRNYPQLSKRIHLPDHETVTHTFLLDLESSTPSSDESLEEFRYDRNFMEKESEIETLRSKLFALEGTDATPDEQRPAEDKTQSRELEMKKKIYLTLKGSLSGDEAAHKILKYKFPDSEKKAVVDILVTACSQETTYSKFYGIVAERLCSSHKSWKAAFGQSFHDNYSAVDEFQANQVRNMGKFWGHILASDYLGFEVFESVHMNANETSSAGRVYLKFLFQELVLDLSIDTLQARLDEPYIQPFLVNLFPKDDAEKSRFSINYFTAIGLGRLTEGMRQALADMEKKVVALQDTEAESGSSLFSRRGSSSSPKTKAYIQGERASSETDNSHSLERSYRRPQDEEFSQTRYSESLTRSRTSVRRRSRTPTRRRSRTPTRRRSRTPARRRSRSPNTRFGP